MEKFLETINNTPVKEIGIALGIKSTEARKVSAARPFANLEDLASASGLPLEKIQTLASQVETPVSPEPIVPVEPETAEPSQESAEDTDHPGESERPRRKAASVLWKIFLWLVIIAIIAAGLYYGIPLFKRMILDPLQSNTTQVGELTTKQQQDVIELQQKISDLQNQVSTLDAHAISAEETLAAYQETLAAQGSSITGLTGALATARSDMNMMNSILAAKVTEQQQLARALQLLSRSRLYLSQSNYGLAREDISATRSLLFSLLGTISAQKEVGLRMAIERLDFALVNLPAYPVVAVYDLDIAWQLLVDDLPAAPDVVTTPAIFETATPFLPTPTVEMTETPAAEVTPTPQP